MTYTPQTWADYDQSLPLSAARMAHLEAGIAAADAVAATAATAATTAGAAATANATDLASLQAQVDATPAGGPIPMVWGMAGPLVVGSSPSSLRPGAGRIITKVRLTAESPPAGGSVVVDVYKNGVSIFPGTKPSLSSGQSTADFTLSAAVGSDTERVKPAVLQVGPADTGQVYRTAGPVYAPATTTTAPRPTMPTGVQAGELLCAVVALTNATVSGSAAAITALDGWTIRGTKTNGASVAVFWLTKTAGAAETVPQWTLDSSRGVAAQVMVVSAGDWSAAGPGASSSGATTAASTGTITTTTPDELLLVAFAGVATAPSRPLASGTTSPATATQVGSDVTNRSSGNNVTLAVYRSSAPTAGSYGPWTETFSAAATNVGLSISVKDGPGGSPGADLTVEVLHEPA